MKTTRPTISKFLQRLQLGQAPAAVARSGNWHSTPETLRGLPREEDLTERSDSSAILDPHLESTQCPDLPYTPWWVIEVAVPPSMYPTKFASRCDGHGSYIAQGSVA